MQAPLPHLSAFLAAAGADARKQSAQTLPKEIGEVRKLAAKQGVTQRSENSGKGDATQHCIGVAPTANPGTVLTQGPAAAPSAPHRGGSPLGPKHWRGDPRKRQEITELARRIAEGPRHHKAGAHRALVGILNIAEGDLTPPAIKLQAWCVLMDRAYGRAPQTIDVRASVLSVQARDLSRDELLAIAAGGIAGVEASEPAQLEEHTEPEPDPEDGPGF